MWNLQKVFSLRTIKVCRFEIIDGVKYVYCIKRVYKFILRDKYRSLTLASMCFLYEAFIEYSWGSCLNVFHVILFSANIYRNYDDNV